MIKLSINQNKCAGCGYCMDCDPNIFEIDKKKSKAGLRQKDKLVKLLSVNLSPKKLKDIKETIKGCPAQAIAIIK